MTATALATLGYIFWTLALIVLIELIRVFVTLRTGRAANSFLTDGSDVSPFAARLARAHANCVESFPLIGGTLLLALATGNQPITDPMALWLLLARVGQSCVHLVSGRSLIVLVRFGFFIIQLAIVSWWLLKLSALI